MVTIMWSVHIIIKIITTIIIIIIIIIIEGQHKSCDPVTCHVTRSQPAYRVGRPGTAARPQRQGTIFFQKEISHL